MVEHAATRDVAVRPASLDNIVKLKLIIVSITDALIMPHALMESIRTRVRVQLDSLDSFVKSL